MLYLVLLLKLRANQGNIEPIERTLILNIGTIVHLIKIGKTLSWENY